MFGSSVVGLVAAPGPVPGPVATATVTVTAPAVPSAVAPGWLASPPAAVPAPVVTRPSIEPIPRVGDVFTVAPLPSAPAPTSGAFSIETFLSWAIVLAVGAFVLVAVVAWARHGAGSDRADSRRSLNLTGSQLMGGLCIAALTTGGVWIVSSGLVSNLVRGAGG